MTASLHGAIYGPPVNLWYKQGVWAPSGSFATAEDVENGDTSILVNDLPTATNMFAPVAGTPPSTPGTPEVGRGKYLVLDPATENVTIQLRRKNCIVEEGSNFRLYLDEPVSGLSGVLGSGAEVGMARSPVFEVGDGPRVVRLVATTHGTNSGEFVGMSTGPDIGIKMFGGSYQDGPFHFLSLISGMFNAPGGDGDLVLSKELELPSLPYFQFEMVINAGDSGDNVVSLSIDRGA